MSPSIIQSTEPTAESDFDLQKWLKEIEGAENLMNEVETKADNLQAKVDALLLEVGQPLLKEGEELTQLEETTKSITLENDTLETDKAEAEKRD